MPRPDDETFTNFFKSINDHQRTKTTLVETSTTRIEKSSLLSLDDLNSVEINSEKLLIQKRNIPVQKRREATKNPVKALAARKDIKDEYTEIITGVAERETKRLNIEIRKRNFIKCSLRIKYKIT